jgi:DNA-binding CsgD family transcriptional regulator
MSYANANAWVVKARKEDEITAKQDKFIKEKIKGHTNKDAAILAGYSPKTAQNQATHLMKNERIMLALDKAGLTDEKIADVLNTAIYAGLGVEAKNGDALKGIEMVARLRGHLKKEPESLTQTNIYINELTQMSDSDLSNRVAQLTAQIKGL